MKTTIQLIQILNNLRNIPRTGMTLFAGLNPDDIESIAEHNFKAVYASMIFGDIAIAEGHEINMEQLLRFSVSHDWAESILGDIPTSSPSYKSFFEEDIKMIFKKAETQALFELSNLAIEQTKTDYSKLEVGVKEKAIAEIADIMSILIEVLELKAKGHNIAWFDYLWANTIKRLEEAGKLFNFTKELVNALNDTYKEPKKPNPLLTKPQFQEKKD